MENHVDGLDITILPEARPVAAAYTVMDREELEQLAPLVRGRGLILCAVTGGADWNRDLSPWPAKAVFREDFAGGAGAFLGRLTERVIPACEESIRGAGLAVPEERIIFGYSLCGLFALWSAAQTRAFTRAASMSGSLWYDGFTDWFAGRAGSLCVRSVYLSLGDRECRARNPRMASVEKATDGVLRLLKTLPVESALYMEPGGHFRDVPQRVARGLIRTAGWISDPFESSPKEVL